MRKSNFYGIIPVIATAMDDDGNILEQPIRLLIDDMIAKGAHGLAGLGEGSGFHKLSVDERLRLTEVTVEQVNGRVPVMIGTSANNLSEAILLSRAAKACGADAIFLMPPYLAQLRDDQMRGFYHGVAATVDIEIVLQDNKMSTGGGTLSLSLIAKLAAEIPAITYIKEEVPPAGSRISELMEDLGGRIPIISGNGGRTIISDLERGAVGCMPSSAVVGGLVQVYRAYVQGEIDRAYEIFRRFYQIITFCSDHYGPGVAEIHRLQGIFPSSYVRPPCGLPLDEIDHQELRRLMAYAGDLV